MFAKAAIALVLLVGAASSGLAAAMNVQTVSTLNQKFDALAAVMRDITAEGLFAEEYEAILELAQNDPQLRDKVIEYILTPPK